ncbi:hypothetical protein BREVNS_1545 [Brevinematales bacterium NS]|nr:hypothetical protein BREVNS_1545 [Brevinematales bacterium NS]
MFLPCFCFIIPSLVKKVNGWGKISIPKHGYYPVSVKNTSPAPAIPMSQQSPLVS